MVVVLLLFPDSSEIRDRDEPPRRGRRFRSGWGNVWVVDEVVASGVDTYTVTCVAPRRGLEGTKDLTTDLLERARESISLPAIRRRRRETRRYLP